MSNIQENKQRIFSSACIFHFPAISRGKNFDPAKTLQPMVIHFVTEGPKYKRNGNCFQRKD